MKKNLYRKPKIETSGVDRINPAISSHLCGLELSVLIGLLQIKRNK